MDAGFDVTEENILDEAKRLTSGDRNAAYGSPLDDYLCTAALLTALVSHKLKPGEEITYQDAMRFMIAVKLSRDTRKSKRDNRVDIAGYAQCLQWAEDEETIRRNKANNILDDPSSG